MNDLDAKGKMPGDAGYNVMTTMLPTLDQAIKSDYYKELPTKEDKLKVLSTIVGNFKSGAKRMLIDGDPDLAVKIMAVQ
jgi:hypothetical protein